MSNIPYYDEFKDITEDELESLCENGTQALSECQAFGDCYAGGGEHMSKLARYRRFERATQQQRALEYASTAPDPAPVEDDDIPF